MADNSESVVPPVASPPVAVPVNPPLGWPTAAAAPSTPPADAAAVPASPPAAARVDRVPARSVESPPPPPSPEPKLEALQPQPDAAPRGHQPAPAPVARRNEFVGPSNHVPALLGAVSALAIIILGSFAGRLLTRGPSRRPQLNARPRNWRVSGMEEESPGIVPILPGSGEVAREKRDPGLEALASPDGWGLRGGGMSPRAVRRAARPATPPSRESTRVLEQNVRELLHRLQADLRSRPAKSEPVERAAPPVPADAPAHVASAQELNAVLAIWRAKRSG